MSIWPPAVLFDAVYASAVLHRFGFGVMGILEKWGDVGGRVLPWWAYEGR
jgi:hypothetical protein